MNVKTSREYISGYDAKSLEIKGAGWYAARDEFNRIYPPGKKWTGSSEGLRYSFGEFQALFDQMPSNA